MEQVKKRVLIHSIVFSPDGVSTAYLYNDIALGLKASGYDVVVLTTTPHYNMVPEALAAQPMRSVWGGLLKVSNFQGIKVYHVPLKKYKSTLLRMVSFVYWHIASLVVGIALRRIHYVLSPSPPLTIGLISLLIAKIKGGKSIYNVQEVYPDLLINQGGLKSGWIIKLLKGLERLVYNQSAAVTTIDQTFYNQIAGRFDDTRKLHIIPNFVDTGLYKPLRVTTPFSHLFPLDPSRIRVVYAGNIGYFQDWEPILYAATQLQGSNIDFWIVGEGVQKAYLKEQIEQKGLTNIFLFPYQQREVVPLINNLADIHLISVSKEIEQQGFPSKVYTSMACAKPLIVVTGKGTPLYGFLHDKDCALLVSEERNEKFLEAVRYLAVHPEERKRLGDNGLAVILGHFSKEKVVKQYVDLISGLT